VAVGVGEDAAETGAFRRDVDANAAESLESCGVEEFDETGLVRDDEVVIGGAVGDGGSEEAG